MHSQCSLTLALAALAAITAPTAAFPADLIEPWPRGISDTEFFVTVERDAPGPTWSALVGGGTRRGLSLGASVQRSPEDPLRLGFVAFVTHTLDPWTHLDVWVETGVHFGAHDVELDRTCFTLGGELSRETGAVTSYARLAASTQQGRLLAHPLAGVRIPLGSRVQLHLELSGEQPAGGPWPLHVAVGPNLVLREDAKLVPELSLIFDRATGRRTWAVALGIVLDPRSLARAF